MNQIKIESFPVPSLIPCFFLIPLTALNQFIMKFVDLIKCIKEKMWIGHGASGSVYGLRVKNVYNRSIKKIFKSIISICGESKFSRCKFVNYFDIIICSPSQIGRQL